MSSVFPQRSVSLNWSTPGLTSGLKILHLNICSLCNISHLSQLRELNNHDEKFDIITVFESWLNTTITSAEIKLDGYKLFWLDRPHKGGGGVCAYIRSELKPKVLKDFSYIADRNYHQLWLRVQFKKSKAIVLCVVYLPHDTPLNFSVWRHIETSLHSSPDSKQIYYPPRWSKLQWTRQYLLWVCST